MPLFQNESKCEAFHIKMSSASSFIFMEVKVIFMEVKVIFMEVKVILITMVSHLDSL